VYSGFQSAPGQTILTTLASLTDVSVVGATNGQVLTYSGGTWIASATAVGADNLGDHTATQNLMMGAHNVVGTGQVSVTDISVTHVQLKSPDTLACNAGTYGTIRYNAAIEAFQMCRP